MKKKEIISWIVYIACLIAAVFLINTYVTQRTMVSGNSMNPNLYDKDQLMMDKLSYRFHDPERFDIVVLSVDDGSKKGEYYIKRVIGLPGETVEIADGYIYIDGEKLDEQYGKEIIYNGGRAEGQEVVLGEDEYFVLGDNRNNSDDSRFETVGNLHRDNIVGKAFVRLWPFERMGILRHQ